MLVDHGKRADPRRSIKISFMAWNMPRVRQALKPAKWPGGTAGAMKILYAGPLCNSASRLKAASLDGANGADDDPQYSNINFNMFFGAPEVLVLLPQVRI